MAETSANGRQPSLKRLRAQRDRLQLRLQIREARQRADSARRLRESFEFDWLDNYINLLGELRGPGPFFFGPSTLQDRRVGRDWPIFANEVQLAIYRQPARILCTTNAYAIGLLNGLTSYVIGSGCTHRIVPKKGKTVSEGELSDAQEFLDAFHRRERWWSMERELFGRKRRDGEYFLWVNHRDGVPWARTIEPEQVMPPYSGGSAQAMDQIGPDESPEAWSFGLLSSLEDTQSIRALWFRNFVHPDGHLVPFSQIVHGKANVDRVIKRGFTDFSFSLFDSLQVSDKLRRNLGIGAAVRAALAGIRQHETTSSDDANTFQQSFVDNTTTDPITGRPVGHAKLEPGSFADMPKGVTFVDPPSSPDTSAQVEILQACLRGATTRYNAPDWLASAAAADNTFAGALTAESPFIKFVDVQQKESTEEYAEVDRKVLRIGCETGQLPHDLLERVDVKVEAPNPQARNTLQQAQENDTKLQSGVMSVQQWCEEDGRDYAETMREIEEHAKRVANIPQPGQPQQPPGGEGGGDNPLDVPDLSGGAGEHQDLTEPHPPGSGVLESAEPMTRLLESAIREAGFTGTDSHGHKWVSGKQVKAHPDQGGGRQAGNAAAPNAPQQTPQQQSQALDKSVSDALANVPAEAKKGIFGRLKDAVHRVAVRVNFASLAPDILDTIEDTQKIWYRQAPPIPGVPLSSGQLVAVGSYVLAKAILFAKSKLGGKKPAPVAEAAEPPTDKLKQTVDAAERYFAALEEAGLGKAPSRAALEKLLGQQRQANAAVQEALRDHWITEAGFTGVDAHGHKWVSGKQVAIGKEKGGQQPSGAAKPAPQATFTGQRPVGKVFGAATVDKLKAAGLVKGDETLTADQANAIIDKYQKSKAAPASPAATGVRPMQDRGPRNPDTPPQAWPKDLTPEQKGAVATYTTRSYKPLNAALRSGGQPPEELAGVHQQLQAAFAKAPLFDRPLPVLRGMDLKPEAAQAFLGPMIEAARGGKTIAMDGYLSTTVGDPGGLVAKQSNVLMHIDAVHGLDTMPVSNTPEEHELMLNHGSRFKVRKVTRDSKGNHHVYLEQLPPQRSQS